MLGSSDARIGSIEISVRRPFFLQMIQDLPHESSSRRIIIIDAFDEISHHQCDLEAVTGPSQSAASLIARDFIRPLMIAPGPINMSMIISCICKPECRISGVKFNIIDCQLLALRPTRCDLNGFISLWLEDVACTAPWSRQLMKQLQPVCGRFSDF